jgi:TrmH family RNA methyltransferase
MITSTQNPKLKLVRNLLGRPRARAEAGAFIAEGVRLVEEALAADWPFKFILTGERLSQRGRELVEELEEKNIEVEQVSEALLNSISETENSQGLLAVLNHFPLPVPQVLDFILIADRMRDPGNLGTLLRASAAAGVQAALLAPETTDAFAPKVVRAGMGAHFRMPIHNLTWEEIQAATKSLKIFLADSHGIPCWEMDFRTPLALIVGGEAEGASEKARKMAEMAISIPMLGKTESLNAGVAGAILLFEVVRQRQVHRQ